MDEIRNALLSASSLYSKRPDWFRMFGPYDGVNDVLFSVRLTVDRYVLLLNYVFSTEYSC